MTKPLIVYHEATKKNAADIVCDGLTFKSSSHEEDQAIGEANILLDELIPEQYATQSISRQNCNYAYFSSNDYIHDIVNGQSITLSGWQPPADGVLRLRLTINPAIAYISDLDAFDAIVVAIKAAVSEVELRERANYYWQRLIPANEFMRVYTLTAEGLRIIHQDPDIPSDLRRIEVMLTDDVAPENIAIA